MNKKGSKEVPRKRGRPAGKNRVPLSVEERRARNAQYERERRVEMTEALAELAEAAGCESSISTADLLATVISQLQQASRVKHSSDIDSLRRCNKNLMAQIETLEQRTAADPDAAFPQIKDEEEVPCYGKRKRHVYEEMTPYTNYVPLPEHSPPQDEYYSPESSPEQKYEPPQAFSPTEVFEPEPHISEAKYSPEHKFLPEDRLAAATTTTNDYLPLPKPSPPSYSSDCNSPEQSVVDYSSYQFAGSQIPTPEYQISADPPEYIVPEPVYSQNQDYYRQEVSSAGYGAQLCPTVQSAQQSAQPMVSELQYPAPYISPPLSYFQSSIHHSICHGPRPVEEQSTSNSSHIDPRQMRFLSTEDLISLYL